MSWPLISDFSRLLKTPKASFKDPSLRDCKIELDHLQQPKPRSGNFATVYRGYRSDNSEFAIKVFNRRADDRQERYDACSRYLSSLQVNCLVGFEYQQKGIRSASDNQFYPLLIMDWVEGVTLFEWVRDRCRERYAEALLIGAEVWLHLTRELSAAKLVHGDLQHGNIMVTPQGHFKLVDYDCLCVPELLGRRNLETGLPPYQHPQRDAQTQIFDGLDNFSALFIYVALRALAANPQLWFTYVESRGYDKLLFQGEDFQNPAQSPLYYELMQSPDRMVRDLTYNLFQLAHYPLKDVPPIDEVMLWCHSIEELIGAQDWDKVVQLVKRMGPTEQIAANLQPYVTQAQQRVTCREALEAAYQRGDEVELQRLYRPELFENYPAASQIAKQASQAPQVRRLIEVLQSSTQLRAWNAVRDTWRANLPLLTDRPSTRAFQAEYDRLCHAEQLTQLLSDQNSDDQTVIDAWQALQKLGGHPLAEGCKPMVEQRAQRQAKLREWKRLVASTPKAPTLESDRELTAGWSSKLFDGWLAVQQDRALFDAAKKRLHLFAQLQAVADGAGSEQTVAAVCRQLSPTYHDSVKQRFQSSEKRLTAYKALTAAVEQDENETDIIDAWNRLAQMNATSIVPPEMSQRVQLARKRWPLVRRIQNLSTDRPADELDEALLEAWDDEILRGCAEVEDWKGRLRLAQERQIALVNLRNCLKAEDEAAARKWLNSSCLSGYRLPDDIEELLSAQEEQASQGRVARKQALGDAIRSGNRSEFVRLFDLAMVREICQDSPHHQTLVTSWTEGDVLPEFATNATQFEDEDVKPLEAVEETRFRGNWRWPNQFSDIRCQLMICDETPTRHAIPEDIESSVYSAPIYRRGWLADQEGHSFVADDEWLGKFVVLWGCFDLGFQTFWTEPLVLGQLQKEEKQKRRWKIFG